MKLLRSAPRQFWFERLEDLSGTSGTGIVAEGIVWSNGWVSLCWLTEDASVTWYESIEKCEKIHGHGGKTKIVWVHPTV